MWWESFSKRLNHIMVHIYYLKTKCSRISNIFLRVLPPSVLASKKYNCFSIEIVSFSFLLLFIFYHINLFLDELIYVFINIKERQSLIGYAKHSNQGTSSM